VVCHDKQRVVLHTSATAISPSYEEVIVVAVLKYAPFLTKEFDLCVCKKLFSGPKQL